MTKKRRKLKSSITLAPSTSANAVHDRRAVDLPYNASVAVTTVPDPYGFREFATHAPAERNGMRTGHAAATDLRAAEPSKLQVIVSLRNDPLRTMHLRGRLTELQYMAGIRYRDDADTSIIGGARGIDYSRPAVDGGRLGDPLRDSVSAALDRLGRADAVLRRNRDIGHNGVALCRAVLGEGLTVADFARRVGAGHKHGMKRMGDLLRSCLDILAEVYGLATRRVA